MVASIWDPLVSIGTMVLALATFALVAATFVLARNSRKQVYAQWLPVVLLRQWERDESGNQRWAVTWNGYDIFIHVENVGRGPALGLIGDIGGQTTWPTALAPGDATDLSWEDPPGDTDSLKGVLRYEDLAGQTHTTEFELRFGQQDHGTIVAQRAKTL